MAMRGFLLLVLLGMSLVGCGTRTPYVLVESELIESSRRSAEPDVTETSAFRKKRSGIETLGLRPPDVCADQGISAGDGAGRLQLGVMRTRCGVEMAELERALSRAGYEVVSWNAIRQQVSGKEIPLLDAAKGLGVDVLLQVNSLERFELRPGRDARWERRFWKATTEGEPRDAASVSRERAAEFDRLIATKEASLGAENRIGATINVSGVWVESGSTIWFYEWSQIDDVSGNAEVDLLLDCRNKGCVEVRKAEPVIDDGPVSGSIAGVSRAGGPNDESQAIFSSLVRALVTDLAERFAGRR
ncbi:MAG: hypothetical protein AB8G23_24165 [Myxococcota bacterium]